MSWIIVFLVTNFQRNMKKLNVKKLYLVYIYFHFYVVELKTSILINSLLKNICFKIILIINYN